MRRLARVVLLAGAAAIGLAAGQSASANTYSLTGTGSSLGFGLSTFLGGYDYGWSASQYGFVSVGVASNGNMLAPNNQTGQVHVFSDVDNQTIGNALSSVGTPSGGGMIMATAGGVAYGAEGLGGRFYKMNDNGTVAMTLLTAGDTAYFGMWGNPVNGHLIASSNHGLIDIDPIANAYAVINSTVFPDGVTVSPNGLIAYVANYTQNSVDGYLISTGALVFTTYGNGNAYSSTGPDGMGVLAGNCGLGGSIVVNNNDGTVGLIDPSGSNNYRVIAQTNPLYGQRGDFASLDTNNGSLLISGNDGLKRITAPRGCAIGQSTVEVPAPESLGMLALPAMALLALRRRWFAGFFQAGTGSGRIA